MRSAGAAPPVTGCCDAVALRRAASVRKARPPDWSSPVFNRQQMTARPSASLSRSPHAGVGIASSRHRHRHISASVASIASRFAHVARSAEAAATVSSGGGGRRRSATGSTGGYQQRPAAEWQETDRATAGRTHTFISSRRRGRHGHTRLRSSAGDCCRECAQHRARSERDGRRGGRSIGRRSWRSVGRSVGRLGRVAATCLEVPARRSCRRHSSTS